MRAEPNRAVLCCLLILLSVGCRGQDGPPYEPEQALETFELPPGFRLELVASEPQITDPVDLAFDPDGRLYVAEMPDYPAEETDSVTSRIKLLEDRDGDGFFETSTVFAEDLPFVNGVMPWRRGVLVTKAPEILYFEDTDGDRRADVRRVVLTGFAATNPQLRMSSLEYGIDNWIYGAYSRAGGAERYPQFADRGRALRFPDNPSPDSAEIHPGTDFRFRPSDFVVEPAGGMSQFGNAFDAAGNRFTVWNNKHLRHVVIPHRYLARNPYLSEGDVMASVPDHGDAATVYPITKNPLHLHESEIGHFTSACGTSVYTDTLFPGDYRRAAFVCEPVHNLVHVDLLSPRGATFVARRAREGSEFLASTDPWFHPVNTTIGPDGALYVADFYRKLVEHPTFIARADSQGLYTFAGMLQDADFYEGQDRGRIYRVVPEEFTDRASGRPSLSNADSDELLDFLDHPNLWWRITAQRLIVDRREQAVVPALERLAAESTAPEGRIHALWTLDGLNALGDGLVLRALGDESPAVREQSVRLAEMRLSNPEIRRRLLRMAGDPDERVQFQLALTLGSMPADRSFEATLHIALRHLEDPWFRLAVLTGAVDNPMQWFIAVSEAARATAGATSEAAGVTSQAGAASADAIRKAEATDADVAETATAAAGVEEFLRQTASLVGARQQSREIAALLAVVRQEQREKLKAAALRGLDEGLQRGGGKIPIAMDSQSDLLALVEAPSDEVQDAALAVGANVDLRSTPDLRRVAARASETAVDSSASQAERVRAVKKLGLDPQQAVTLEQVLGPRHPSEVRRAAAEVLIRREDASAREALLKHWGSYTQSVRDAVESGLIGRRDDTEALLHAIEAREVEASLMSRRGRMQLLGHPDTEIRRRALAVLGAPAESRREDVIRRYHEATRRDGNAGNGRAVFEAECSTCHRIGDRGVEVGPDLSSLSNRTRIDLLTQILDPNDNIAPGYEGYVVETTDRRTVSGVLTEEDAAGVTLRSAGGAERTVLRRNIAEIHPMAVSLMPETWEQRISIAEMADLLEFIKSVR